MLKECGGTNDMDVICGGANLHQRNYTPVSFISGIRRLGVNISAPIG